MASVLFERCPVLVRGGGDLASGVIYKLARAGFPVSVAELPQPKLVRRAAAYGEAVYSSRVTLNGLTAVRLAAGEVAPPGCIGVYVAERLEQLRPWLSPVVLVDARMDKHNPDTRLDDAPLVIALGPGYTAGVDCHYVIETQRGHHLGRVIDQGPAEADTGEPDAVQGITHARVLRAPAAGLVLPATDEKMQPVQIGAIIQSGQVIAVVAGQPVIAPFAGILRGLVHPSVMVSAGMKIGDLDPRGRRDYCFTISDKARAIGGGVLEAVLAAPPVQPYLRSRGSDEIAAGV
ncbi:MAG: selenium-dependent molybdenum cofactor biosynthesis protein YqeB [Anaerolineae bacterium]|nr:selenium-dependent molybdenum cofactor biosynthesis protein YqeB [Anaerolineae bacterium]